MKQVCRREREKEREGAAVAPGGRTVVGVATCGGASGRRADGSVAWRLERWREREREREREKETAKKEKNRGGRPVFWPNSNPICFLSSQRKNFSP